MHNRFKKEKWKKKLSADFVCLFVISGLDGVLSFLGGACISVLTLERLLLYL